MNKYTVPTIPSPISVSVSVPGSKSITNRAFLIAALACGKSVIKNPLKSDDTKYMKEALQELGIKIEEKESSFVIEGRGGEFDSGEKTLFLGNAGTATRFLTAIAVLREDLTIIEGDERMRERPINDLTEALNSLGVDIETKSSCPPVRIKGGQISIPQITVRGDKSSQYISALLLLAPLLSEGLVINIENTLVSTPYIDLTLKIMNEFGVIVENENYQKFIVKNQKYTAREYEVEADASSASYWFALAAVTGSEIEVQGISKDSSQGDIQFLDVLKLMNCKVEVKNQALNPKSEIRNPTQILNSITVTGPKKLKALGEINMNKMPDVAMTLAVVAAVADGETVIKDVANMRIKETDRVKALVTEMKKMKIEVEELEDGLKVVGSSFRIGGEIATYDDHRMAMCFAILGTVTPNTVILNPECTSKTYPLFFEELERVCREK